MKINRLSIIGLGLIGSSIALAARDRISNCQLIGYDRSKNVGRSAVRRRIVDKIDARVDQSVINSDLIVIATPLSAAVDILKEIGPNLPVGTVVTDVCSTKRTIVQLGDLVISGGRFVGSHPMFGNEHSGIDYADGSLVAGSRCMVTPTKATNALARRMVEQFWSALGMFTLRLSATEHDRHLARASHLPQLIASVLMSQQDAASMSVSGKGLLDTTRLAGSNPDLWSEIVNDNSDHISRELKSAANRLKALSVSVSRRQTGAIKTLLREGQQARHKLLNILKKSEQK